MVVPENTMRAWQVQALGSPAQVMVKAAITRPEPGPGEVQLRVLAAGLGLPDVLMCQGRYAFSPTLPFTPGQELVGVVSALGEGVEAEIGQRVMAVSAFYRGSGSFADYCLAPAHALYPLPDSVDASSGAVLGIPYHTAYIGLCDRAALQPGETVLVLGAAGGSGAAAIQLAKALGANVIAVASGEQKMAYCQQLGADHVVSAEGDDLGAAVLAASAGLGVNVIYDPVGGEVLSAAFAAAASGCRILAVGFASGSWGQVPTAQLVARNSALIAVYVGAYPRAQMLHFHQCLMSLFAAGKLQVNLSEVVDFDHIPQALEQLAGRQTMGKLAVLVASD